MVGNERAIAVSEEAWRIVGTPRFGGILVVADHASDRVPAGVDLGIDPALINNHIAVDLGVAGVAQRMAEQRGVAAFLGNVSRLVCDFNREEHAPGVVPIASDGHAVPGNALDHAGHEQRLARYFRPYHDALARVLDEAPPLLILSLHRFTPHLASKPDEQRPWACGVLYNEDATASRHAIALLREEGLNVGDQEPYSGRLLNATMNRHAEADGRPYFGIEIRQDLLATEAMQAEWAERLGRICNRIAIAIGG